MKKMKRRHLLAFAKISLGIIFSIGIFGPLLLNENSLIPYDASTIDVRAMNYKAPALSGLHLLGTDAVGRDILAGCVYGVRNAFVFSIISVSFTLIIGLFLGILSGFYYDNGVKLKASWLFSFIIGILCFFLMTYVSLPTGLEIATKTDYGLSILLSLMVSFALMTLSYLLFNILLKKSKVKVNVDLWINRFMESLDAIPSLFILITTLALIDANFILTAIVLGALMWVGVARICRAEIMKIKAESYIESAEALGLSNFSIIKNHILPNISRPILIQLIFIFSNCILIESTLNFIGIGTSIAEISWGSMLAEAGQNLHAWWLLVFPGIFIFLSIYSLRVLASELDSITQDTPL